MRLVNTASLTLAEFIGLNIPPYAILSHTWEQEEVLFADIQNGTATSKKGYAKIVGCCRKAAEHGFEWVWIDTCCIDKSSSAELSEAINSMYQWYESSVVCYAYLQDVAVDAAQINQEAAERNKSSFPIGSVPAGGAKLELPGFSQSRWFTRGWTLQELVAPKIVEFYSFQWVDIGTKGSLAHELSLATGIPVQILSGGDLSTCSVAERMSWASSRKTTREEDMAYCLLGLFNVNMPLLYGEGAKSFVRLQERILQQEEDYSILAWTLQHDSGQSLTGVLASSPSEYTKKASRYLRPPTLQKERPLVETASDMGYGGFLGDKYMQPYTFSTEFGLFGATYDVLHDKDYERLRQVGFQKGSITVPMNPPELTSRGLRVSLPLMRSKDEKRLAIAWIYCKMNEKLLCIGLQATSESSLVYGRHSSAWLINVDKRYLESFIVEDLVLFPNGRIAKEVLIPDPEKSLQGSSWGRLRVISPDTGYYLCYVVSTYPVDRWSLDEFFFRHEHSLIGVAMFECATEQKSSRFEVCCGIQNGHPWCSITETLDSRLGEEVEDLKTLYEAKLDESQELRFVDSDRDAKSSIRTQGVVFTAVIRKKPAFNKDNFVYTLHVEARNYVRRDPWVDLYLQSKYRE